MTWDTAWAEFLAFNDEATKAGSGFTLDQLNGAAGFGAWLERKGFFERAAAAVPLDIERLAEAQQSPDPSDKHWHRGPSASCPICRFGEKQVVTSRLIDNP